MGFDSTTAAGLFLPFYTMSPSLLWRTAAVALALLSVCAHAETEVVDLRSHAGGPLHFVSFVALTPGAAGTDPSALVVWGDPDVARVNGAYETVGLISPGIEPGENPDTHFGRLADASVLQLPFEALTHGVPGSRDVMDALTLLVDEDAYRDAYEVFGGPRDGTYFEDQTISPGDSAARSHGVAQIISYFAGIGSRLGESVPDTLHLASAAGDDPPGLNASFSPEVFLRNMIATAVAHTDIVDTCGTWDGQAFGKWPNGFGQFSYLSGDIYTGEVHRGQRRGVGTWESAAGLTISGTFDGNSPTEAMVVFPDGDSYYGTLANGHLVRGTYQWRSGSRYVGSFSLNGQLVDGTLTTPAGQTANVARGVIQLAGDPSSLSPQPRTDLLVAEMIDLCQ